MSPWRSSRPRAPTGEKCPLKVLTDMKNSRARAYAFYALRKGFPDLEVKRVGWMVGSKPTEAGTSWLRAAHKQAWWNDAVARRVAAAVRRVRVPEQFMEAAE